MGHDDGGGHPPSTGRGAIPAAEPPPGPRLRLWRWRDRPVVGVALVMVAAGFAQFSPAAALADVAEHFGDLRDGDTVAEQAGLPGSVLGAGLAAIRLAALVALPLAAVADRAGRRRVLLIVVTVGLGWTVAASASPSYWWFVVALTVARPFLTATDTVAEVMAAELTATSERAKALAFLSAAYGVGAGSVAVLRGLLDERFGFRAVFATAAVLLVLVAAASPLVEEPDRFRAGRIGGGGRPMLGALARPHRRRLALIGGITFAAGFVTGPATTLLFVYAENVRDVSRTFTGVLVVLAGAVGLGGLLAGRALADRLGRRPTGALSLVLLAAAAMLTYAGPVPALAAGYLAGVFSGAAFGTPVIALAAELFPTSVRAAVAGWLVVAGVTGATSGLLLAGGVADASGSFAAAMAAVCVPAALMATLFAPLPETRGRELEHWAGGSGAAGG